MCFPAQSRANYPSTSSSRSQKLDQLPTLEAFKRKKETERSGFSVRGKDKKKKRVQIETVSIQVGVMDENKSLKRGETLPLKISSTATPNEILEAAVSKHSTFNKRFDNKMKYRLLFRDGSAVKSIPGTSPEEPFTLKRYKEESGFGYSRITLYLQPIGDIIKVLKEVLESDASTSSEDECHVSVHTSPLVNSNVHLNEFGESSVVASENSDKESVLGVGLLVNCPTCSVQFPISQIEEHADMCADFRMDFPDPNPIEASQFESPGLFKK